MDAFLPHDECVSMLEFMRSRSQVYAFFLFDIHCIHWHWLYYFKMLSVTFNQAHDKLNMFRSSKLFQTEFNILIQSLIRSYDDEKSLTKFSKYRKNKTETLSNVKHCHDTKMYGCELTNTKTSTSLNDIMWQFHEICFRLWCWMPCVYCLMLFTK